MTFPYEIQDLLKRAAKEAANFPAGSLRRRKIIEQAIRRVRLLYPHCFVVERLDGKNRDCSSK